MNRLEGKCALVTGAAQGIGLACAERLRAEGAKVVGADISDKVIAAMEHLGARGLQADVGDRDQIDRMVAQAIEAMGKVDILVSNAGVTAPGDFLDYDYDDFERVLRINLHSAFLGGQAVARHIVERGGTGSIINMSSVNGVLALPNQTAYVTSKGRPEPVDEGHGHLAGRQGRSGQRSRPGNDRHRDVEGAGAGDRRKPPPHPVPHADGSPR
jgi:glucose 1-dehydrogenase